MSARSASTVRPPEDLDQTLRDLRGNRLAMIFQEPMTSLNPSFTIGDQIVETILRHLAARERARASGRSTCCAASTSRRPSGASTKIRTSSPAACASA